MGKPTKWRHMIGQADSDDGVRKPRLIWQKQADKMAITRGKIGMVSFLHKLEIRKLCLKLVSFLHKLETKINYAWNRFHFYTSLKRKQTMLEKLSMPPAWWLNSRYIPPSFSPCTWVNRWREWRFKLRDLKTRLVFYENLSKTRIEQECVSLF